MLFATGYSGSCVLALLGVTCPNAIPPYQTCHRRFQQWVRSGILKGILEALGTDLHLRGLLGVREAFHGLPVGLCIEPRRRNLWVTDTVEWCREGRLASPANPVPVGRRLFFRSQLPFEPVWTPR